jgi:serine/threonine protein kinase
MKLAYIVMEQGITSLESVIQRKIKLKQVFRSDEIEAILTVLLRVFLFLEKRNIAHCDIKPENIIIMSI